MNEEFKDIIGYEGIYQISINGKVKSLSRVDCLGRTNKEIILKNYKDSNGYYVVGLTKNSKLKHYKIHILLYKTFISDYDTKYFDIDHINRIRSDNRLENLRIVSPRNNSNNKSTQCKYGIGVCKDGNKYLSQISIKYKHVHLGSFSTPEQAHQKYLSVKFQLDEIEKITRNYDFKRTKIGNEYFIELFGL